MKLFPVLATVAVSYATLATAQTERDLDSHVHGAASLNVAINDATVFIELETPWNNMVGFEYAPQTDEEHALVDEALGKLNDPALLFAFDAGDCAIDEITLENGMSDDEHGHDKEHDEEHDEEHGHDDEHDDEHGHDKEHDEHGHDEEASTHSTMHATYSYACKNVSAIKSIDMTLFTVWSGFEDLDVQLVGEKGQALAELSPSSTVLDVEQVQ